jgi:cis-3-alkyl-4-acyloxetan-2-one decarboxylase
MNHSRSGFESEYPFPSHYLNFDGIQYHYVDEGEGEPILFVHGNPTWSFAWRNLIKELSPQYRTLAVDHVGCGFSDKPADYPYVLGQHVENLGRFVEELDLRNITLVAHDWGGAIGTGAAIRLRDRFSRIVLMNTAAFRSQRIPLRISVCRIPLLGALGVRGLNLFAKAATRMAIERPERMTTAVKTGYLAPYDNWANRVAIQRFVEDIPLRPSHPSYSTLVDIENGLESLTDLPMLLVWGERDWCFTVDFLREFQQRFPQAETLALPAAGHYVFEDAHEEIAPRLREFLKQ